MFPDFGMPPGRFVVLYGNAVTFFTSDSNGLFATSRSKLSKVKVASVAMALNDIQRGHRTAPRRIDFYTPLFYHSSICTETWLVTVKGTVKKDFTSLFDAAKMPCVVFKNIR